MFSIKNNKTKALNALNGNWTMMVLNALIFMVISGIGGIQASFSSEISNNEYLIALLPVMMLLGLISSIIPLLIAPPMQRGYSELSLRVIRSIPLNSDTVFIGFSDFVRSLLTNLITGLITSIPVIIAVTASFIILLATGITAAFRYSSNYIADEVFVIPMILIGLLIIAGIIFSYTLVYRYKFVYFIMTDNPNLNWLDCMKKSSAMTNGIKMNLFLTDLSFIGWGFLCLFTFGIGLLWLSPYMQVTTASIYNELYTISEYNKANSEFINNNFENNTNTYANTYDINPDITSNYNAENYPESRDFFDNH